MKKLIAICLVSCLFSAAANAQTSPRVNSPQKKSLRHQMIKALRSPSGQAALQQAKTKRAQQAIRREGQ